MAGAPSLRSGIDPPHTENESTLAVTGVTIGGKVMPADNRATNPMPDEDASPGALQPIEQVYRDLRAIARKMMSEERPGHTLQATELVHEVVIRLARRSDIESGDRARWIGAAADEMRRVLIDRARMRNAAKRRPKGVRENLDFVSVATLAGSDSETILALDAAFIRLVGVQPRAADVVRMRFYLGLSVDETGEVLGISRRTVLRDWEFARAFLAAEISRG